MTEFADKHYVTCPECGKEMSAHALLCRDCYKRSGGVGASIYLAAKDRGEASPRSKKYVKYDNCPTCGKQKAARSMPCRSCWILKFRLEVKALQTTSTKPNGTH